MTTLTGARRRRQRQNWKRFQYILALFYKEIFNVNENVTGQKPITFCKCLFLRALCPRNRLRNRLRAIQPCLFDPSFDGAKQSFAIERLGNIGVSAGHARRHQRLCRRDPRIQSRRHGNDVYPWPAGLLDARAFDSPMPGMKMSVTTTSTWAMSDEFRQSFGVFYD